MLNQLDNDIMVKRAQLIFKSYFDEFRKKDKSFYASKSLRGRISNNYFIEKKLTGDNHYTLFNAITRTARDEKDNVGKRLELERVAGTFIS